ncbi:hypothetical protein ES708_12974 [subsurface metagenome]
MEVHFINVGPGNMVLIIIPDSKIIINDCNIPDENEDRVLSYVKNQIGKSGIDIFINSHRDADHMRGIQKLENEFGIKEIWDCGVAGTTTDSTEYSQYMSLKREKGKEVEPLRTHSFGDCLLRVMNGKNADLKEPNEQSLVIKLEYKGSGIMLPGDTNYKSWKEFILPKYSDTKISSSILLASHHGSLSFFDDPEDTKNYYIDHIKKLKPFLTVYSVGDNDTHPDEKAVKLYEKYSLGYDENKVKTLKTNYHGTIKFEFKEKGASTVS